MTNQIDFNSWHELEEYAQNMKEKNATAASQAAGYFSPMLFRGQANAEWLLETTLEREKPQFTELAEYYRVVAIAKTQIETFTSRRWDDVDYLEVSKLLGNYDGLRFELPAYELLVYLRHHGFPSPLLDWTRSLYVAAFFAFQKPESDQVAIFLYQEHIGNGKAGSSNESQIKTLGPNIRSHPRHFLQQGEYTMCCQYRDDTWHFADHASVFSKNDTSQDRLLKLTVPSSEATAVMKRLDEYNINAFSLFQSEESLMSSLSRRLISLG